MRPWLGWEGPALAFCATVGPCFVCVPTDLPASQPACLLAAAGAMPVACDFACTLSSHPDCQPCDHSAGKWSLQDAPELRQVEGTNEWQATVKLPAGGLQQL